MDKVKIFLAVLKKHHFWVMAGLAILFSLIGWFLATSKLYAEAEDHKKQIEAKFAALNKINSEVKENQTWIDQLDVETGRLKVKVAEAWAKVYSEQKNYVLKWPAGLGAKNVATLEKLGPNDPIPPRVRDDYLNYIQSEFPRLLEIVDAKDFHLEKAGAPEKKPAAKGDEPAEHDYKVLWDSKDQAEVAKRLDWQSRPSGQEVRDAQEDLWVYQALLTIIKKLNINASGNYNAKVKGIEKLLIASEAATEFQSGMSDGHVEKLEEAGAAGAPAAAPAAPGAAAPAAGRYVDDKGVPLAGAVAAPANPDAPPPAAGGPAPAEFKRMPVVMRLIMDQREITQLLVECANSPLPVEVRQFRVWNTSNNATKNRQQQQAGNPNEPVQGLYDVKVELEGIIYIFNPPDRTKLGDAVADVDVAPAGEAGAAAPPAEGAAAEGAGAAAGENGEGTKEEPAETK